MKRKLISVLALALCLSFVIGCAAPAATPDAGAKPKLRVGVTFKSIKQEFDVTMKQGIEETAAALGVEIVVVDAQFDMGKQRAAVDDFITQKMDAIIMSPVNSTGSASMIQAAQDAGIPVITIDIGSDEGVERCYVASDNIMGGTIIAEYLVNTLKVTSGKVVVLNLKEDISVRERCEGFTKVLEKYPDIQIISDMNGGGTRDESLVIAESMLQGNPDVNIVFGSIGDMVVGVSKAAKSAGRDDLILLGYDADYDVLKEIEAGACKAITAQFPFNIGKTAVETAIKLKDGEDVPRKIQIPVEICDPNNLKDFLVEK